MGEYFCLCGKQVFHTPGLDILKIRLHECRNSLPKSHGIKIFDLIISEYRIILKMKHSRNHAFVANIFEFCRRWNPDKASLPCFFEDEYWTSEFFSFSIDFYSEILSNSTPPYFSFSKKDISCILIIQYYFLDIPFFEFLGTDTFQMRLW